MGTAVVIAATRILHPLSFYSLWEIETHMTAITAEERLSYLLSSWRYAQAEP